MMTGLAMMLKASGLDPEAMVAEFRGQIGAAVTAMQAAQASQAAILARLDVLDQRMARIEQALSIGEQPIALLALSTVKEPT